MKTIKTSLLVLFALTLTLTTQAKKVELKYTLEKGAEISFKMVTDQDISQEVMGQSQATTTSQTQVMVFTVLDVTAEGNYLMKRKIAGLKVLVSSPMGDMEYNSDEPSADGPFKETLGWLTETPLEFVMSSSGEILEIMDAEKLAEEFTAKFSGGGVESQMVMGLAGQFSSEEGIIQSLGSMLLKYPEGKIKIGTPWEVESKMQQVINFKNTTSIQVKEASEDEAILALDGKIELGEGDNTMEMQGMEMEYDLAGGSQGSFEVDLKTGLVIKAERITTISGVISVDSPQLPAPMSIPMTIKTTDTISREK